jgi:hypothetical protein
MNFLLGTYALQLQGPPQTDFFFNPKCFFFHDSSANAMNISFQDSIQKAQ